MNRKNLAEVFSGLKNKHEIAFIPFTVLGDPDKNTSIRIIKAMIDGGADILELGMPFSDPVSDGPVIQKADMRALDSGIKIDDCFDIIREIRKNSDIPIGLLMYANLIFRRGIDKFYRECKDVGINSVLVADVPYEERGPFSEAALKFDIQPIYIVTPLTSDARVCKIASACQGFLYVVTRLGVTGTSKSIAVGIKKELSRLSGLTDLPLCVGFGISTPEHVGVLAHTEASGAITGSALVRLIEKNLSEHDNMIVEITEFVRNMKAATVRIRD
ncbi:MAG: tryptophan synthase subunit alpha [Candidatus Muiribacteriaceae bacterium]